MFLSLGETSRLSSDILVHNHAAKKNMGLEVAVSRRHELRLLANARSYRLQPHILEEFNFKMLDRVEVEEV
jgi:hypothetical protein